MIEIISTSAALFVGMVEVMQTIYTRLLEVLNTLGPFQEDPKKTSSIHLVHYLDLLACIHAKAISI